MRAGAYGAPVRLLLIPLLAAAMVAAGAAGAPTGAAAKEAKIKIVVEHHRNALFGLVYSHESRCVGARRTRVFEITGSRRRLVDTGRSVRRRSIGYFRLALGRFKWNQTYRVVTSPRRVGGSIRCEGDRQTYRIDCARDAVLDIGLPTTNCYPRPEGPAALEGTVRATYEDHGVTQVLTTSLRLTRIANLRGEWLHEATLAYRTAPGTLSYTVSGTSAHNGCSHEGSGQLPISSERPDDGNDPPSARLVFALGTRSLAPGVRYHVESTNYDYWRGNMICKTGPVPTAVGLYPGWFSFGGSLQDHLSVPPPLHTEPVRDDGTLSGVLSLPGIEAGGDNETSARLEWNLRPAP
jgi:hypothetical protein